MAPRAVVTPENLSTDFKIDRALAAPVQVNIGEGLGRDEQGKIHVNSQAFGQLVPRMDSVEAKIAEADGVLASTDYVINAIESGVDPRLDTLESAVAAAGMPLASQAYVNAAINESAIGAAVFTGVDLNAAKAAGLAGTALNATFLAAAVGGSQVSLYRHDAGPVATLLVTYPSMASVTALQTVVDTVTPAINLNTVKIEESTEFIFVVKDSAGNIAAYIDATGNAQGFDAAPAVDTVGTSPRWSKTGTLSWLPSNVLMIFGVMGQSNADAVNSDTGDAIISGSAVYPTKALMVPGGPRITVETGADLVPLVEAVNSGRRESLCSGFANNLIAKVEAAFGFQPYVATILSAHTGLKISELNRGSSYYNLGLAGIRDATAYALRQGLTPIYAGTLWVQGEAELSKQQVKTHARALQRLSRDIAADAMAITGQADAPCLFTTQVATGNSRDLSSATWFPDSSGLALYETDGDGLIRLSGPMYQMPISSDNLHLSCAGQYWQGAQFAQAVFGELANTGWHPIKFVAGRWTSSTILRLEFAVPDNGDLTIALGEAVTDTVNSVRGFQAVGPTGAALPISSVTVPVSPDASNISARFVDISFATAPGGPVRIAYAHRRDGSSGNGPVTGMRGLLASAATYTPLIGGAHRHWCPAFIADIAGL